MPRVVTKKRTSPEASPSVISTRRILRRATLTKAVSKNKSNSGETSKTKANDKSTDRKLLRKSKRIVSKKQSTASSNANESIVPEKRKKLVKRKLVNEDNAKEDAEVKGRLRNNSSAKSKNESVIKRRKINKKINKNNSTLRQLSLKESFSNQTASKQIVSRTRAKNRKDDLELIRKQISPDKENISIVIARMDDKQKSKLPVYKSVPLDDSTKDGSGIYDFKFDTNDSKERIRKKKKRRVVKKNAVKKLQKGVWLRSNVQKKGNVPGKTLAVVPMEKKSKKSVRIADDKTSAIRTEEPQTKNVVENMTKATNVNKENLAPLTSSAVETKQTDQAEKPTVISIENLSNRRIMLKDNSAASNSGEFMPFRPTNIFNNKSILQEKKTPNNSLFEKSFSPITKSFATFDPGSPWRAPPLFTFSQVRNVFQSTPQNNNKLDISYGRLARGAKNESKNVTNVIKARDSMQKNNENVQNINKKNIGNIGVEKSLNTVRQKKKSLSLRRFGTEITNLDHSNQINNPVGDTSERIIIEAETPLSNLPNQSVDTTASTTAYNVSKFDEVEEKENTTLNYQTPKRVPKKGLKKHSGRSPLKAVMNLQNIQQQTNIKPMFELPVKKALDLDIEPATSLSIEPRPGPSKEAAPGPSMEPMPGPSKETAPGPSKELVQGSSKESIPEPSVETLLRQSEKPVLESLQEPIPGPSGLQNIKSPEEQKVLRQSNLNSFLNLEDMPESTTIKTRHGIFNDSRSPPVSAKPSKKLAVSKSEIKAAFGFNEDDSDENMSPTNSTNSTEKKKEERIPLRAITENRNAKPFVPSRLSIGQIRNKLLVKNAKKGQKEKENKRVEDVEDLENQNPKDKKSPVKRKNRVVDVTSFSDTFDILSETELSDTTSTIPLFADLEPSHFTKPPRHSYKRKRAMKHSFSDESSSEEEAILEPEIKRKKGKLTKQDEKKLQEWIDSINQTFEEVDQHDLLVE